MYRVACDGSCLGNPGPGGWAVIVTDPAGRETTRAGSEPRTTNNRMELTAAIESLASLPAGAPAIVSCDSEYVVRGLREWLPGWKRRNWKTSGGKPVKNQDLWRRLAAAAAEKPSVRFEWVRGHAGHPQNERADRAAFREATALRDAGPSSPPSPRPAPGGLFGAPD